MLLRIVVAPLAGAWIEICISIFLIASISESLPSRERGLKCTKYSVLRAAKIVAPLAGAWIEI